VLDFKELSQYYPTLRPYIFLDDDGKVNINFRSVDAVRQLTAAILAKKFSIIWWLPPTLQCLSPPVPNRYAYLKWISDHLKPIDNHRIKGYDLGTGMNAIYVLLGVSGFKYRMVGSDIDNNAVTHAKVLVEANMKDHPINNVYNDGSVLWSEIPDLIEEYSQLSPPVVPKFNKDDAFIVKNKENEFFPMEATRLGENSELSRAFDFVICNPPFFDYDKVKTHFTKKNDLRATEKEYPGGEEVFVKDMIDQSTKAFSNWYTAMISNTATAKILKDYLTNHTNIETFEITLYWIGHMNRSIISWIPLN